MRTCAVRFVIDAPAPPEMPRLPRKLRVRPKSFHTAIVRADMFEGRWERLRTIADADTRELMLRIEEEDE